MNSTTGLLKNAVMVKERLALKEVLGPKVTKRTRRSARKDMGRRILMMTLERRSVILKLKEEESRRVNTQ
jgi:hypothetical protein